MRVLSLDHVHVYAADPEASLSFWEDVLDGERLGSIPAGGDRRNHFIIVGGQILAISAFPAGLAPGPTPEVGDGAMKSGFGVAHLGINVDDLPAWVRRLERFGVDVHSEPREAGLLDYVYFTGPDGVIVELTQYDLPPKLAPAMAALATLNRVIHRTRATVTRTMLKLAPTG